MTDTLHSPALDEREKATQEIELMYGPKVGFFRITRPTTYAEHPEEYASAWVGVVLPIRRKLAYDGGDFVQVLNFDGFNALTDAGVSDQVRQYWRALMIDEEGRLSGTLEFSAADGDYKPYEDQRAQSASQES